MRCFISSQEDRRVGRRFDIDDEEDEHKATHDTRADHWSQQNKKQLRQLHKKETGVENRSVSQKDGISRAGDVIAASECTNIEARTSHALDTQQRHSRSEDEGAKKEAIGRESTDVDEQDNEHHRQKKSDFGRNSDVPTAYERKPS